MSPAKAHVSPFTGHATPGQQLVIGMQSPPLAHTIWSGGHVHVPPGKGHDSPRMLQSLVLQHSPGPLQPVLSGHSVCPDLQ